MSQGAATTAPLFIHISQPIPMKDNHIWYSLSVADIQDVAQSRVHRRLTDEELAEVIQLVENSIPWFETIQVAIDCTDTR